MNDPDYFFNVASPAFVDQIMNMAEGSVAEIMGKDGSAYMRKFEPWSYALAKKTGLIDLEINSLGSMSIVQEVLEAVKKLSDNDGVRKIGVQTRGMKIVHLYFYPKESD